VSTNKNSPEGAEAKSGKGKAGKARTGQARSAARLASVQALYQMEITGDSAAKVQSEFETHRLGAEIEGDQYHDADVRLFRGLLAGVIDRQTEVDQLTNNALSDAWKLGKVDSILRAIFRAAASEMIIKENTPIKVIINEYVDIAKAFFPDQSEAKVANAVMDHMARAARPDQFTS